MLPCLGARCTAGLGGGTLDAASGRRARECGHGDLGTIAAVVLAMTLVAVLVDRRRGSTGASRSLDINSSRGQDKGYDGRWNGPAHGGDWSGGDGSGG